MLVLARAPAFVRRAYNVDESTTTSRTHSRTADDQTAEPGTLLGASTLMTLSDSICSGVYISNMMLTPSISGVLAPWGGFADIIATISKRKSYKSDGVLCRVSRDKSIADAGGQTWL